MVPPFNGQVWITPPRLAGFDGPAYAPSGTGSGVGSVAKDTSALANVDFSVDFTQGAGAAAAAAKKVGATIGATVGGLATSAFLTPLAAPAGTLLGQFIGKQFDRGGAFGKSLDKRKGVRDSDGWGARIEFPDGANSVVAPWGKTGNFVELGDWQKHRGDDGNFYTGFATYLIDKNGTVIKRLDLGTRYARLNPDGTFLMQSNFGPDDKDGISYVYKITPDGFTRKVENLGRWGEDPPTAFKPFEGFILKKDLPAVVAAMQAKSSPPAPVVLADALLNPTVTGGSGNMLGGPGTGLPPGVQDQWNSNGSNPGTNPPATEPKPGEMNWLYILIAVVVLIILIKVL